ncbi:hypothetical protein [Nocardia sp. NPDC052566]|uniref:hypothetical protein n=1 Tax=Nocardia sp. NPDC052566 TaxID=3364330 RepID=UPI0037C65C86
MTMDKPPERNDPQQTPNEYRSAIYPMAALTLSAGLAAAAGVLTDWNTASLIFLATTTLLGNARRTS